ncbi:uncharacterized protein SCHCODRAFT_02181795 [Schizophyllum commune H4-8]|uniref:Uncharacterized protein n=1 Tax=Schizophyllum commune (strain H4-8 / FGSC 9210) TaxID=578458 RepID=D8PYP5_SCHCM|nr:uncharacterized protein SCHCODRAFT_02181795 [Schizophyllum commune H4-8]KAI5896061.1 hypothetical protein SCHCODRAFT_02181795 [Schizophyllum commune H4-8]
MNRAPPVDATVLPPLPDDLTIKTLPRSSRGAGLYAELIHQLFIRLDIQLVDAFHGERVTLVVHGGAPILTHRKVAEVQQQTRRTTTRDVNYLAGAFAAEWAARGVSDAPSRLHAAAQEVALQIGVDLGWLEADTDAFLPTWTDSTGKLHYPVYDASVKQRYVNTETLFTGRSLSVIGVPAFWAIAQKLQRFEGWDKADICLLLKSTPKFGLSSNWTLDDIEGYLQKYCARSYPLDARQCLKAPEHKIVQIVPMLEGLEPIPDGTAGLPVRDLSPPLPPWVDQGPLPPITRVYPEGYRPDTGPRLLPTPFPLYPRDGAPAGRSRSSGYPNNVPPGGAFLPAQYYQPHAYNYDTDSTESMSSGDSDSDSDYGPGERKTIFAGQTPPPAGWQVYGMVPPSADTASMSSGGSTSGASTPRIGTRNMAPSWSPVSSVSTIPTTPGGSPGRGYASRGELYHPDEQGNVPPSPAYSLASSFSSMSIANFPNPATSRGNERQPSQLSQTAYPSPTRLPDSPHLPDSRPTSFASSTGSYSTPLGVPQSLPVPSMPLPPVPEPPQLYTPRTVALEFHDPRGSPKSVHRRKPRSEFIPSPP